MKYGETGVVLENNLVLENNNREMRFLTETEVKDIIGSPPMFLKYQGLISAIPSSWKRKIRGSVENQSEDEEGDYKLTDKLLEHNTLPKNCTTN